MWVDQFLLVLAGGCFPAPGPSADAAVEKGKKRRREEGKSAAHELQKANSTLLQHFF